MSETAKSVVLNAKSLRPCADPFAVKTTCKPLGCTSAIHWFTALELQLDPEPWIRAWAAAFAGAEPTKADMAPNVAAVRTRAARLRFISEKSLFGQSGGSR